MDKAVKTQTFVSAETARRIRHQFLLTDMGQYQMKGKDLPEKAFLLERELSDSRGQAGPVVLDNVPPIGRDEEMATLRSAATRSRTGPDGAIALMIGDVGMGKTRRLDEIAAKLADDCRAAREPPLGRRSTVRPHRQRARDAPRADGRRPDKQIHRPSSLAATRPSCPTWSRTPAGSATRR